jgi:hypothetical protein
MMKQSRKSEQQIIIIIVIYLNASTAFFTGSDVYWGEVV